MHVESLMTPRDPHKVGSRYHSNGLYKGRHRRGEVELKRCRATPARRNHTCHCRATVGHLVRACLPNVGKRLEYVSNGVPKASRRRESKNQRKFKRRRGSKTRERQRERERLAEHTPKIPTLKFRFPTCWAPDAERSWETPLSRLLFGLRAERPEWPHVTTWSDVSQFLLGVIFKPQIAY